MKVGIDVFSYDSPGSNSGVGPGVYVWNLLPELFAYGQEHHFVVFANRESASLITPRENVTIVVSSLNHRQRWQRIIHEQFLLPRLFRKHRLDLLHCLGNNIPFVLGSRCILTVHDLMWLYYLRLGHVSAKNLYFWLTVPVSLRRAGGIITVSNFIAEEIAHEGYVRPTRISVIPEAAGFLQVPPESHCVKLREKYQTPFLFTITTSLYHKNLITLLRAFAILRSTGSFKGKLIVAGQLKGTYHHKTQKALARSGLSSDVELVGYIGEEEKTYCLRHCEAFVYPSRYEGFGLPILEAMKMGSPVVASRAASIPEVGGDCCLYFDPESAEDLASQIELLLRSPELRSQMRENGYRRAQTFDWAMTARATVDRYEALLSQKNSDE